MSKRISSDDVAKVARLARLDLGDERLEAMTSQLDDMLGHFADIDALLGGSGVYLVVDIRDVPRENHVGPLVAEQPDQDVEHDGWPGVADMRVGIDRWTADIHRHPVRIDGHEFLLATGQRVVQCQ